MSLIKQEGKKPNPMMVQMMGLADDNFITIVINMFKDIKKKMEIDMELQQSKLNYKKGTVKNTKISRMEIYRTEK